MKPEQEEASEASPTRTLFYVHDPMCSWCWAFRPTWSRILEGLPADVTCRYLLGGLAPDSNSPMPAEMRQMLSNTWSRIQQRVPGTRFNFEFWNLCQPRRSTYPACRAVIAARQQGAAFEEQMILGIQQAYYQQAKNPSDDATLIAVAEGLGLDREEFALALNARQTQACLNEEIRQGQSMGVRGFPGLVLETAAGFCLLSHDYLEPRVVLEQLSAIPE